MTQRAGKNGVLSTFPIGKKIHGLTICFLTYFSFDALRDEKIAYIYLKIHDSIYGNSYHTGVSSIELYGCDGIQEILDFDSGHYPHLNYVTFKTDWKVD